MDAVLGQFRVRLKALRTEKKLKQSDMADLLGITIRQYQRMEYGEVNVAATTLCFLADFFGVTTDYLLGREGNSSPQAD